MFAALSYREAYAQSNHLSCIVKLEDSVDILRDTASSRPYDADLISNRIHVRYRGYIRVETIWQPRFCCNPLTAISSSGAGTTARAPLHSLRSEP